MSSEKKDSLPHHVAIVMDGNGRWAQNKGMARSKGHSEGLKRAKEIVKAAATLGIKYVTLYVFSTENWKRTEDEVGYLMNLVHIHLKAEFEFYKKNKIRILHAGKRDELPSQILDDIDAAVSETKNYEGTTLVLALNYGGRDEIVRAVKKIIKSDCKESQLCEKSISSFLDVPEMPDVDLLIRTGGEFRLSNFLLWQASYAELIFTKTLWPDYTEKEFLENIKEFQSRQRRFGSA